ncbi:uncharacterized protein PHALS_11148 [Plasmopara halstedii]|uniref:Uncharacterized protein n=1 Tax=Plasmopara halstedii TaxID=4781 RepID=A0A0P1AI49_PLAHL|nr:uncharacterized protein PHALS_11148 [Plasmopara halstedii]CEG40975.1 hypothetical protein PHALS_11148 [Plasmopara halstedii]|eukprot:XP_024577344.1 hypothetical protein PHALS_11148 [Plasmopara halstedii]
MEQGLTLLMTVTAEYTETQLVLLVLSIAVVTAALLSYFVVAPEYEKRLDKQYAAIVHASSERQVHSQKAHNLLCARIGLRKYKSLGAEDVGSSSSDDDGRFRGYFSCSTGPQLSTSQKRKRCFKTI